ncbi:MAG: hypothetical protein FJY37_05010 [Betaproteobacteria bacterium]|nr:hypothetical protein [Betaproteobacteria bacterium]
MDGAEAAALACLGFPPERWQQVRSTNALERTDREIKRRTDVAGISRPINPESVSSARSWPSSTMIGTSPAITSVPNHWPSSVRPTDVGAHSRWDRASSRRRLRAMAITSSYRHPETRPSGRDSGQPVLVGWGRWIRIAATPSQQLDHVCLDETALRGTQLPASPPERYRCDRQRLFRGTVELRSVAVIPASISSPSPRLVIWSGLIP